MRDPKQCKRDSRMASANSSYFRIPICLYWLPPLTSAAFVFHWEIILCIPCRNMFMTLFSTYKAFSQASKSCDTWRLLNITFFWRQSLFSSKSDQSMFNMSEWIAPEWWNWLQTNTKHNWDHIFAYRAHYSLQIPMLHSWGSLGLD